MVAEHSAKNLARFVLRFQKQKIACVAGVWKYQIGARKNGRVRETYERGEGAPA